MMYAAISADIVSSTSLSRDSMIGLHERLKEYLAAMENRYEGFWGRIVRGDSVECILPHPEDAFEAAILLKAWVKSFEPGEGNRPKRFNRYGLRVAVGIGEMKTVDRELDMMDGDAIYRSGRALNRLVGRAKYAFSVSMENEEVEQALQVIGTLVNHLLNNASARKCETLCTRILSADSGEAAARMGISVSGVNQTLKDLGWNAIEQAIAYYRRITSNL